MKLAQWPDSEHITPVVIPARSRMVRNRHGEPLLFPVRVLAEDEYQLLLAGFLAAGGKVMK